MSNSSELAAAIEAMDGFAVVADGKLTGFELGGDRSVGDLEFVSLPPCETVTWISVAHTSVSDESLTALSKYPNLVDLDLSRTGVTLQTLPDSTAAKLKVLKLWGCRNLTPSSFAPIGKCVSLEKLLLRESSVTDECLKHLAGLRSLVFLDLAETAISDTGLGYLRDMPKLKKVEIINTRATLRGFDELRERLPNVGPNYYLDLMGYRRKPGSA